MPNAPKDPKEQKARAEIDKLLEQLDKKLPDTSKLESLAKDLKQIQGDENLE